jgi:hypothetical protein
MSSGRSFSFHEGTMRVITTASLILFALGFFCAVAMPADMTGEKRTARVMTADTVWNTDRQTILAARQRCADTGGRELEECFADAMQSFGASPEAVAFTRSFGGGAFVRKFQETGRIDIAQIIYPFRPNENHGILLVNGEPPVVDVDDIARLPKEEMEQDRTYAAIRKNYPRVTLWPGDRSFKQVPLVETLSGGGQAFVVSYILRNFCHACEVLGSAFFSFDFDKGGKLVGIHFLRVELPPKKPPKNEARKGSKERNLP